jgi:hypothetical protein
MIRVKENNTVGGDIRGNIKVELNIFIINYFKKLKIRI